MNNFLSKRRITKVILLFFVLITPLFSRDINLDKFYIKKSSDYLSKLTNLKINSFSILQSTLIDRNIMYCSWSSGSRIIYLQENGKTNILYEYYPASRLKKEITRLEGDIIFSRASLNGKYMYLKFLNQKDEDTFNSNLAIINLTDSSVKNIPLNSLLLDFSLSHYGESVFYEKNDGIYEFSQESGKESLFLKKEKYSSIKNEGDTVLLHMSPNRQSFIISCGNSGNYKSVLYQNGIEITNINDISSSSEVYWLNNERIVYRGGGIGNFVVQIYDTVKKNTSVLSGKSLNTNITLSSDNVITFVEDGAIVFYNDKLMKKEIFPVEGEDSVISPTGNEFCCLYNKNLFLSKRSSLSDKLTDLKRNAVEIYNLYSSLKNKSSEWDNDFSSDYISRKYALYKILKK